MSSNRIGRRELLFGLGTSAIAILYGRCASAGPKKRLRYSEQQQPVSGIASTPMLPVGAVEVFTSGQDGYACMRVPSIVTSNKGTILAFCEGRRDSCSDEGDIDIILRRSTDGGRTWRPVQVLANDNRNPCKNPVPVVLPTGRILLLWLWNKWISNKDERTTRKVYITHSDDDGLTWHNSREITSQVYGPGWTWYGLGPCHGMVKTLSPAAGRIIVPARHGGGKGIKQRAHIIYSDDGGQTWAIGGISPQDATGEATAAELGDGGIMLNSRSRVKRRIVSISRDGGMTFESSELSSLIEPQNGCQASLITYAFHPSTSQATLLFSNPMDSQNRTNGRLRLSLNNGRTWNNGFLYSNPSPAFSGYSDITVLPNRDVGILFESGDSYQKFAGESLSPSPTDQYGQYHANRKKGKVKLQRHDVIAFRRIVPAEFLTI